MLDWAWGTWEVMVHLRVKVRAEWDWTQGCFWLYRAP